MALHPDFPQSPHEILDPSLRWFPGNEDLKERGYEKLLPPLVYKLRQEVKAWRDKDYQGASVTSIALLRWWFRTEHLTYDAINNATVFQYYFAQREAVETVIYLYDVVKILSPYDLMRYDSSEAVSRQMFYEDWLRLVIKMATGSGKTKVLSLLLAWSYFHKLYQADSELARNFLVIAPNIIVLDRIRTDFDGLKIFNGDPIIPDNGYEGNNWQDDFQLTLHIQDEVRVTQKTGNIFLTNIHRVYQGDDILPSFEDEDTTDYFLGKKPSGKTNESKIDLGEIVRNIDELVILNDEAHHIHDDNLAWFKSIQDIHNKLLMKGKKLSLQLDVTATPKHNNGAIFVQTITDYPLVEAIYQNVVKHPVVPDEASRAKLQEHQSSKFTERYRDYLHLGYVEWKKTYDEHIKIGKKSIFFVMTDDTINCDEVAEYLEYTYSEFKDSVLVIHTKKNGEIAEDQTGKGAEELTKLRRLSNEIDNTTSPYKAIISVLMLKEGWDVRNVTTIVGLRAYSAKSNILPEQTLGRGLRRMFRGNEIKESVSIIGTDAFMDFVKSITREGVQLEYRKMGEGTETNAPVIIEVDNENTKKDIEKLDIEIPVLTPRIYREYKNLSELQPSSFTHEKIRIKEFGEAEKREIVFREVIDDSHSHSTELSTLVIPNVTNVIGYFAQSIMRDLRLVSGYDVLYDKLKDFAQNYLFENSVDLNDMNVLRNFSESEVILTIKNTFRSYINELTVQDRGEAQIQDYIKISKAKPFVEKNQSFLVSKKSVFNKMIGDSNFELEIASFLEDYEDIVSYAKNYFSIHFRIDYSDSRGNISYYYPDFLVKVSQGEIYIIETKGREDLDDVEKIKRLQTWCQDVNKAQLKTKFYHLYIKQDDWDRLEIKPKSFKDLVRTFK